jgi:hypothetical protein
MQGITNTIGNVSLDFSTEKIAPRAMAGVKTLN